MSNIEMNIIALANSESQKGNYSLILEEVSGFRRLPIVIGPFEAQAIAVALENMSPSRPLTHDLMMNITKEVNLQLQHIIISKVENQTFYSSLIFRQGEKEIVVDSRTSDAIALSVRQGCPIYTTEEVLASAGIVLDNPSKAFSNKRGNLADYSLEELQSILQQVLAKEDYESAAKIRDAISKK